MLRKAAAVALGLALVACGEASGPSTPSATTYGLGAFPALPTTALAADRATALQQVLADALDATDVPGLAAALVSADHGTWVGVAGTADGEAPIDPAAQFGIGSVTKVIVAAEVLHLAESGAVDLDRPIADYLGPGIPTNGATIRQVLGMRSGIEEYSGDASAVCADLAATFSMQDLASALSDGAIFEPGSRFRYTNANYLLAGLLIEAVTGTSVATALRDGLLADPGLTRLIYQDEEEPTAPVAAPFVIMPGSEPMPDPDQVLEMGAGYLPARCLAATAGPAGGMASDPMTLARFGYLLYGGTLLGDEALTAMTTYQDGYGLAAHDHSGTFGVPAVGHEGTVPGYVASLLAFPDEGLSIAVLSNTNGDEGSMVSIAGRLRDELTP
jgi:D-alanyl-D-alanine carboxypeptidase